MLILGIESSCDETAASVVSEGRDILSSVVASQDKIHSRYGGIVPELASRRHIEIILPVVKEALKKASSTLGDIGAIAATCGPGLVGSLLVGLSFAKSLSYCTGKPLIGVNHLHAHLSAARLADEQPEYPCVGLIVSGGHTSLYRLNSPIEIELLGKTRDDAAGEAFDKVAKLLDLGYPGGVRIEKISEGLDPNRIRFPRPLSDRSSLDFSFSGLKTSVINMYRQKEKPLSNEIKGEIAAGFQEAVIDTLVSKLTAALKRTALNSAIVCGGVAANRRLREKIASELSACGTKVVIPDKRLCTDNAAMIAAAGYLKYSSGRSDGIDLNAFANLEIG